MKIEKLSKKQKEILRFSQDKEHFGLICDGAIRSGKTVVMTISYIIWAMLNFDKSNFAICGKTVQSTERNIIIPSGEIELLQALFKMSYKSSKHILEITGFSHRNKFFVFGGKDESSYALIQGLTLNGVFFDEVALMPESFVMQAVARTTSVENAKVWFNCNPEHPEHWFYKNWILDSDGENKKNLKHLHFLMTDNPILTEKEISRAETLYSGTFKERYIDGKWVITEGLVYRHYNNTVSVTEFRDKIYNKYYIEIDGVKHYGEYYVSIDYGTVNPFSAGVWFITDSTRQAVRVTEYYYDSKKEKRQKTDNEYFGELNAFIGERPIKAYIIDPSASSFKTLLERNGKTVIKADNNVIDGIRVTDNFLNERKILINESCKNIIREFGLYKWDEKAKEDKPVKEFDHAMDDMRYFANTVLIKNTKFNGDGKSKIKNILKIY